MNQLAKFLGEILKQNGIANYEEWVEDIDEAIRENRFEWIIRNEIHIGFYTWLEKWKDNKQYIYFGNLFIEPSYRSFGNILGIRRIMKKKFPNAELGYWVSTKKNKFIYK